MKNFENFIIFLNQEIEKLEKEEVKGSTEMTIIDNMIIKTYIPDSIAKNFWKKVDILNELEGAKKWLDIYLKK